MVCKQKKKGSRWVWCAPNIKRKAVGGYGAGVPGKGERGFRGFGGKGGGRTGGGV